MIEQVYIKNFKSIQDATLPMSRLNLLTGMNGSGKSTFIQAFLLVRQSWLNGNLFRRPASLWLGNGSESLVNVGTFGDVYHQNAEYKEGITIKFSKEKDSFSFVSEPYTAGNTQNTINGSLKKDEDKWERTMHPLFTKNGFQYLSADRITPQDAYPRFKDDELLGKDGQYTAHYLEQCGSMFLHIESLMHERSEPDKDKTLLAQVNLWLSDISPNIQTKTYENLSTNQIELTYSYYDANGIPIKARKPRNVGFGITSTLPILVALLSARPGDIVIIEDPELHIHPKGQSRIGMLMSKAAQAGVQILVETHSDHILNGIRVATKRKWIEAENVNINYFTRSLDEITTITPLQIDKNGRIDQWPKGFFDEWDNMLDELL